AASHRHVDGVLMAAAKAVDEERWIAGAQRRQLEVFYEGILAADAEKAAAEQGGAAKASKPTVARTGRGGGGCGGRARGWRRRRPNQRSRSLHRRRIRRQPERPELERCLGLLPDHARHVAQLVQ